MPVAESPRARVVPGARAAVVVQPAVVPGDPSGLRRDAPTRDDESAEDDPGRWGRKSLNAAEHAAGAIGEPLERAGRGGGAVETCAHWEYGPTSIVSEAFSSAGL